MKLNLIQLAKTIALAFIIIIGANLAVVSQTMGNNILADLKIHQKLWQSQKINHYEYIYNMICFCPPPANTPTKVFVKNKQVISVANPDTGEQIKNANLDFYKSIDQLFEVIQDAVKRNADEIQITYDSQLGYPTKIFIDYIKLAADDEVSYSATNLMKINQ
jgi:hypothetical protein